MTLTSELADANRARWHLARILIGERTTGDIEEVHKDCVAIAHRLVLMEYSVRLQTHDWTHMMSDDPSVYKAGALEQSWLEKEAKRSDVHREMFDDAKKRASARAGPELPSKP